MSWHTQLCVNHNSSTVKFLFDFAEVGRIQNTDLVSSAVIASGKLRPELLEVFSYERKAPLPNILKLPSDWLFFEFIWVIVPPVHNYWYLELSLGAKKMHGFKNSCCLCCSIQLGITFRLISICVINKPSDFFSFKKYLNMAYSCLTLKKFK